MLTLSVAAHSEVRFAVIPIEFSDCRFRFPKDSLETLCKKSEEYFNSSLHGQETFKFILLDSYCSRSEHSTYGANGSEGRDVRFPELALEACLKEDQATDFSAIDHIIFITAGENEAYGAASEWFWPCCESFPSTMSLSLDGKQFRKYAKACELNSSNSFNGHGLICHEAGHLLGIPDLYDTDGEKSGGTGSATYGYLSLMDKGEQNGGGYCPPLLNSIELDHLGYGSPVLGETGSIVLSPVEKTGQFIKIPDILEGKSYLVENRGGSELAIYLTDKGDTDAGYSDYHKKNLTARQRWELNEINCNPFHQCAYALCRPIQVQETNAFFDLNGMTGLRSIRKGEDKNIILDLLSPIVVDSMEALQESVSIKWHSDIGKDEILSCTMAIDGKAIEDKGGCFQIGNLSAGCNFPFSITLKTTEEETFIYTSSVSTLPRYDNSTPFIFLTGAERNNDGSFKAGQTITLSIYNRKQESTVSWYFNGIKLNGNTSLKLDCSGELNAILTTDGGGRRIIRKEIRVK